jgi:uncharacterized C2H2 Zn-finger protein
MKPVTFLFIFLSFLFLLVTIGVFILKFFPIENGWIYSLLSAGGGICLIIGFIYWGFEDFVCPRCLRKFRLVTLRRKTTYLGKEKRIGPGYFVRDYEEELSCPKCGKIYRKEYKVEEVFYE